MRGNAVRNLAVVVLAMLLGGCSVRGFVAKQMADALSGGGSTYASDNDPELIRQATPFSLKLMETVLADAPDHKELLLATCSGFTQYAYAYVNQDADEVEPRDLAKATSIRERAAKLYMRARDYGLRGLDVAHEGLSSRLGREPKEAVKIATKDDVPLLYWTAAAWGALISVSKNNPDLIADQPVVEALIDRALELDESFNDGAIHCFLVSYEPARQGAKGSAADRARRHFDRAVQLSEGLQASPYVAYAEAVCIQQQKRQEFELMLKKALAINVDARPQWRLANVIMQQRARWLLSRSDELFVE